MKIQTIDFNDKKRTVQLIDLKPGEACIYSGAYYIKLDKKQIGLGIQINWPDNHSILFNIKLGSLRAVRAYTDVTPCKAEATYQKLTYIEAKASEILRDEILPKRKKQHKYPHRNW